MSKPAEISTPSDPVSLAGKRGFPAFGWGLLPLLLTLLVLLPTLGNGFVNWDDPGYLLKNEMVRNFRLGEIFSTSSVQGNYHPFSLLSLAFDFALFGEEPFGFHLHNLLLHLLNTWLVFRLVRLIFGRDQAAFLAALLFGIHPMHLESVAWISERKDLLYTAYFLLGLICWQSYLRSEARKGLLYGASLILFAFSLLSKGMAVSFPLILLLLDFWHSGRINWKRVGEKIPFFALALGFGILSILAQGQGNALQKEGIPLFETLGSAGFGLGMYLLKALAPFHLSAFHPYPFLPNEAAPGYIFITAALVLLFLAITTWIFRKKREYTLGMGFFLATIGPVLQLLPVGIAIYAERYSYLSYVGLFMLIGLAFQAVWDRFQGKRWMVLGGFGIWLGLLGFLTLQRTEVWKNGEALWNDVIQKYPDDFYGYAVRSGIMQEQNQPEKALADLNAALERNDQFAEGFHNRGLILMQMKDWDASRRNFDRALELNPDYLSARLNRGVVFLNINQPQKALADLDQILKQEPNQLQARFNHGLALRALGRSGEALTDFEACLDQNPQNLRFLLEKAWTLMLLGQLEAGLQVCDQILVLDPNQGEAWYRKSLALADLKRFPEALECAQNAQKNGYILPKDFLLSLENLQPH
ncbi:MAG: tetratricopeptide repeat protein [Bacteroidia bacterium]|nr:tetratricopeptide repeat protein [Bacteroidia bacterium]